MPLPVLVHAVSGILDHEWENLVGCQHTKREKYHGKIPTLKVKPVAGEPKGYSKNYHIGRCLVKMLLTAQPPN